MKTASLDEIVFRDRNQNYGAYELRKRYDRTLIISFLVALFIVSGMVGIPMVQAMRNKHKGSDIDKNILINIVRINPEDPFIPPPPPPPPTAPQLQKLVYQVPNVVDTVFNEPNIMTRDEALDNGQNDPVPDVLIVSTNHSDGVPDDIDPPTFFPSEPATFLGGDLVDIKLLRSVDKSIDDETVRVLKLSPKWIPAKQGGTPVKQLFVMPVSFLLK